MTDDLIKAADALADAGCTIAENAERGHYSIADQAKWANALTAYRKARSAQDDELTRLRDQVETLRSALEWYKHRVENCNRHGTDGYATRHALAHDLGERAHRALEATK